MTDCPHPKWTFVKTALGVKRTCEECGYSVTESTNKTPSDLGKPAKKKAFKVSKD